MEVITLSEVIKRPFWLRGRGEAQPYSLDSTPPQPAFAAPAYDTPKPWVNKAIYIYISNIPNSNPMRVKVKMYKCWRSIREIVS